MPGEGECHQVYPRYMGRAFAYWKRAMDDRRET